VFDAGFSSFYADLLKFAKASSQREAFHYTSYLLAAGVPAAFIFGGPVATLMDFALGLAIPLHFHIGMRSVLLDYVPNVANQKIALALLAAATLVTTLGLAKLNLFDVGLTEGVKQLFKEQSVPATKSRKEHQLQ
jgi:succinate dehydrogenase hydrophobic anchor subunit